jgi:uncharacterized damage-inducible protein DinB
MSLRDHFRQLAAYNGWANARLYEAALALDEERYRRPVGVFFSSLHGTLNHLLLADRIWLKRLTGEGDHPGRLDAILYEDRLELAAARAAEDQRLVQVVDGFDAEAYARSVAYRTTAACRTSSRSPTSSRIYSTTRRTIAAKRTPASRSDRGRAAFARSSGLPTWQEGAQRGRKAPDLVALASQRG